MAALPRSTTSFRRQGSSGLVWEDRYLSGELNQVKKKKEQSNKENNSNEQQHQEPSLSINTMQRSRSSGGGRAFHSGKITPVIEPPSPKVSACGFCVGFGKPKNSGRRPKPGRRRSS